jgi:hypothetical protein
MMERNDSLRSDGVSPVDAGVGELGECGSLGDHGESRGCDEAESAPNTCEYCKGMIQVKYRREFDYDCYVWRDATNPRCRVVPCMEQ